jgi:hypothetical protein
MDSFPRVSACITRVAGCQTMRAVAKDGFPIVGCDDVEQLEETIDIATGFRGQHGAEGDGDPSCATTVETTVPAPSLARAPLRRRPLRVERLRARPSLPPAARAAAAPVRL